MSVNRANQFSIHFFQKNIMVGIKQVDGLSDKLNDIEEQVVRLSNFVLHDPEGSKAVAKNLSELMDLQAKTRKVSLEEVFSFLSPYDSYVRKWFSEHENQYVYKRTVYWMGLLEGKFSISNTLAHYCIMEYLQYWEKKDKSLIPQITFWFEPAEV